MKRAFVVAAVVVGLLAAGIVGYVSFAPKPTQQVDESLMGEEMYATEKQGSFRDGAPGHTVTGTVRLLRGEDGAYLLRFEDYQATPGPDVYFYLTDRAGEDATAAVESGLRVMVPGGEDDGEATLRGNFNVPLPAGFDPERYHGLSVWCERFNVLFGWAPLEPA